MDKDNRKAIEKIYFDMDGVLANFDEGVRTLCGMEPLPQNAERTPGYDDALWAHIRKVPHFYNLLEPMPGALEMFEEIYRIYGDRCEILTGIPKPHRGIATSAEDKAEWVKRILGPDVVVHAVIRQDKKNYCKGKRTVLIDDAKSNIEDWERSGGTGILYLNAGQTLEAIRSVEDNLSQKESL